MSRSVKDRALNPRADKPWRTLLWVAAAGLAFGLIGLGEIAEDIFRTARNGLHWHKASGDIVIVKIDNQSLREAGRWPWSRRVHARLIDRLSAAGAKRIFIDIQFIGSTTGPEDDALAQAMARSGRVTIAISQTDLDDL